MGVAKEKMMSIAARGYGESNKYVCSGCVKDQYEREAAGYGRGWHPDGWPHLCRRSGRSYEGL